MKYFMQYDICKVPLDTEKTGEHQRKESTEMIRINFHFIRSNLLNGCYLMKVPEFRDVSILDNLHSAGQENPMNKPALLPTLRSPVSLWKTAVGLNRGRSVTTRRLSMVSHVTSA